MKRHNKDGQHPKDIEGWLDVGCPSPVRAEQNRRIVQASTLGEHYEWEQDYLRNHRGPLPKDMLGVLPTIPKGEPLPSHMRGLDKSDRVW